MLVDDEKSKRIINQQRTRFVAHLHMFLNTSTKTSVLCLWIESMNVADVLTKVDNVFE